jgi:hypothetical protein
MSKFYFTEEQDVSVDEVLESDLPENKEIQENFKEEEMAIDKKGISKNNKAEYTVEDEDLEIKYFWVRTL